MQRVFEELDQSIHSIISVENFNKVMGYSKTPDHYDIHEFLLQILEFSSINEHDETVHVENYLCENMKGLLVKLFGGIKAKYTTCISCSNFKNIRDKEDTHYGFVYVDWDLIEGDLCDGNNIIGKNVIDNVFQTLNDKTVNNCPVWKCDNCNQTPGYTQQEIWKKLPNILFFGLKRSQWKSGEGGEGGELIRYHVQVSPPPILEYSLNQFPEGIDHHFYDDAENEATYILFAFIFHVQDESDAGKGHYYINVMDWFSGVWFSCNDEVITKKASNKRCNNDEKRNLVYMVYATQECAKKQLIQSIKDKMDFLEKYRKLSTVKNGKKTRKFK